MSRSEELYDENAPFGPAAFRNAVGRLKFDDPSTYAARYIWAFVDHRMAASVRRELHDSPMYDISVISHDNEVSSLTKRAALVSDHLVLAQDINGESQALPLRESKRKYEEYNFGQWNMQTVNVRSTGRRPNRTFNGDAYDLAQLGGYLHDVAPLVAAGQMVYYPDIEVNTWGYDDGPDSTGSGSMGGSPARSDELVRVRNLVDFL